MGNCHTSEAATILIERPDNRTDRLYFSVTAQEVMSSYPGHYIAALVNTPKTTSFDMNDGDVKKQLKLLRPCDSLLIGHVYRLITFEDVLKELNGRKCIKMGKLLKENGTEGSSAKQDSSADHFSLREGEDVEEGTSDETNGRSYTMNMGIGSMRMNMRQQWRPALQSISEIGS